MIPGKEDIAKVVKAAASYSSHARLGPHATQSGQMLDLPQPKLQVKCEKRSIAFKNKLQRSYSWSMPRRECSELHTTSVSVTLSAPADMIRQRTEREPPHRQRQLHS